jgi:hypothetical protein
MKQLKNKERVKIYRKVYDMLEGNTIGCLPESMRNWCLKKSGLCELINISTQNRWNFYYGPEDKRYFDNFPEFKLLSPHDQEIAGFWWEEDDRDVRKIAIAFCIAIAENPLYKI